MTRWPASETDMGPPLIAWLEAGGWTVYQEVQMHTAGHRADIVAKLGPLVHVVEIKTSLSWTLLSQALFWRHFSNFTSIAVPATKSGVPEAALAFLRWKGIGLLRIGPSHVSGHCAASFRRKRSSLLADRLREEHKTFAPAGNANGDRWTPFQATKRELVAHVRSNPGVKLKDAMEAIDHHYSSDKSARCAIGRYLEAGIIAGVETRREGRMVTLWPEGK